MDRQSFRDKKLVYHLTAISNLSQIILHGLLSREALGRGCFTDVADHEILEGRAEMGLHHLVPFHFMHKSPFDYAVVNSNSRQNFVLLGYERGKAKANNWKVCPQHPRHCQAIHDWDDGVESIDWEQMDKYPRDYEGDHACKMTCMAEALSPHPIPWVDFSWVFVKNEEDKQMVQEIIRKSGYAGAWPKISVNSHMIP